MNCFFLSKLQVQELHSSWGCIQGETGRRTDEKLPIYNQLHLKFIELCSGEGKM
jgi:hypothetical protein